MIRGPCPIQNLGLSTAAGLLVSLHVLDFAQLFHLLALHRFLLSILYGRRFLKVFTLLPLANDSLFLDLTLEFFQRLLQGLIAVNYNICDV